MAAKNQHYVPRVFLKSWEGPVRSKAEPNKIFQGIYLFDKSNLSVGDGKTREVVLSSNHTYTIDYSHSFLCSSCQGIANDFSNKILTLLQSRREEVRINGVPLITNKQIIDHFAMLDEWEFFHLNSENRTSKKATTNAIKDIRCYVIEDAFSQFVESKWENVLNSFIDPAEQLDRHGKGEIEFLFEQDAIVEQMVEMFTFMALRNPQFDLLGIFPAMRNLLAETFSNQEFTDEMLRGLWLSQIYKALYGETHSFFDLFVQETIKRCGCMLFKINDKDEGCFITSDNPAFTYHSCVMSTNHNGMYFPLTPHYLLFIGLNSKDSINKLTIRTISNSDIRKINNIILNQATKNIVSTKRNLGYIL